MTKGFRWLYLMGVALWMAGFLAVTVTHGYAHAACNGCDDHSPCIVCYLAGAPATPAVAVTAQTLLAPPQWVSLTLAAPQCRSVAESFAPAGTRIPRAPPFSA